MTKYIVAQGGRVVNIVSAPAADAQATYWWAVDDATAVSVGDAFDPRQFQFDASDLVAGKILFDHENRLRDLVRAVRLITSTVSGNSAANTAGLPTAAASADVTAAQFKNAVVNILPPVSSIPPPSYVVP